MNAAQQLHTLRADHGGFATPSKEFDESTSLNSSAGEEPDMKAFLGQFDTVIQAYTKYLVDADNKSVQSRDSRTLQCDSCNTSISPNDRFCSGCGTHLCTQATPQSETPRVLVEKECVSKELNQVASQILMKLGSAKQRQEVHSEMHTPGQVNVESRPPQAGKKLHNVIYQQQQIQMQQQEQLRQLQEQQKLIQQKLGEVNITPRDLGPSAQPQPQPQPLPPAQEFDEGALEITHPVTNHQAGPFNLDLVRFLMKEQEQLKTAAQRTEVEKKCVEHERSTLQRDMRKLSSLNDSGASGRCRSTPKKRNRSLNRSRSTNRSSVRDLSVSTISATPTRRSISEKSRMQEKNASDTSLLAGFFLPNDLRGCATFGREKRFLHPMGFNDPNMPFYFLANSVEQDIKATRRGRSPLGHTTSTRGGTHSNVTPKWGSFSGGGMSPGPGAYDPKWSKSLPHTPR